MGSKELKSGIKIKLVILTSINKLKMVEQLDSCVLSFLSFRTICCFLNLEYRL